MCIFFTCRHKRRSDRDLLNDTLLIQIAGDQQHIIQLLGAIMSKQSDLEDQVAALGGGFDSIVTYLGKIQKDLEAANAAAGDTVDLTPLVNKVKAITAFADGLNPTTPAPPVSLPEDEDTPPVAEEPATGEPVTEPAPQGDPVVPEPAPEAGPPSTPAEVGDPNVVPVTGTEDDDVVPEGAVRPSEPAETTESTEQQ